MITYVITRTENGNTAVWPPFESGSMANEVINTHVRWRIHQGDVLHREILFTPDNKTILTDKNPFVLMPSCVVRVMNIKFREMLDAIGDIASNQKLPHDERLNQVLSMIGKKPPTTSA